MNAYLPRTGTLTTIEAVAAAGWRWLVTPADGRGPSIKASLPHALDNGAWTAHQQGIEWDEVGFRVALDRFGPGSDFIVVPDIVMAGMESLQRSLDWLPELLGRSDLAGVKMLIPVQDGMQPSDLSPILSELVGVFVGGSTDWKLATMGAWAGVAHASGSYCHVGRVNTARRIRLCAMIGADSFDGSGAAKFPKTVRPLDLARRQTDIEGWIARSK